MGPEKIRKETRDRHKLRKNKDSEKFSRRRWNKIVFFWGKGRDRVLIKGLFRRAMIVLRHRSAMRS